MAGYRGEQIRERVREIVSKYVSRETNGRSIISVSTVDINDKADIAVIFVTVIPESEEKAAMDFLKRKRSEIRKDIMKKLPIARIPVIDFKIDVGEKLVSRITEIEQNEKTA